MRCESCLRSLPSIARNWPGPETTCLPSGVRSKLSAKFGYCAEVAPPTMIFPPSGEALGPFKPTRSNSGPSFPSTTSTSFGAVIGAPEVVGANWPGLDARAAPVVGRGAKPDGAGDGADNCVVANLVVGATLGRVDGPPNGWA